MNFRTNDSAMETGLRHGVPLVLAAISLYGAVQLLDAVSFPDAIAFLRAFPAWAWGAALLFSAVSFYAVGQYDILARRQLGLAGDETRARKDGMIAVALSQSLGFGLITGSLTRYRLRPEEGVLRAGQITGLVTALFLLGMAFVTLCAFVVSGAFVPRGISVLALAGLSLVIGIVTLYRPRRMSARLPIPGVMTIGASILWAAFDVGAAAFAFFLLLASIETINFIAFLPVFCVALAAGILSGVPGGVGPFELVLFTLTAPGMGNEVDQSCLVAAVFGYRAVYYLVPALIAAFFVLRPGVEVARATRSPRTASVHLAPRAESAVITQNGGAMVAFNSGVAALWPAGNSLVALFDTGQTRVGWLEDFSDHAQGRNLWPVLYKCSARPAAAARQAGWHTCRVATDAVLDPRAFDTIGAKFAGLRRKLRKAEQAGVHVRQVGGAEIAGLSQIDRCWQTRCGGARGGTMGRFCPDYLCDQLVLVAQVEGQAVAFISLHQGPAEWALDLMRDGAAAPDGTMYLLLRAAIQMAADQGIAQLSLAAVPMTGATGTGVLARPKAVLADIWAARGLVQFKSAFRPVWKPLYMAAPSRVGLCLGALDILREVLRPPRV